MKTGTASHPKFVLLQQDLRLSKPQIVGLLELTWHFAFEYAPAGDVGKWPDALLEESIGWDGAPGQWVAALVSAGWACTDDRYRLVLHDWADHIPEFLKKRQKRRGLEAIGCQCRTPGRHPADAVQTTDAHPTQPNPTEPNPRESPRRHAAAVPTPPAKARKPARARRRPLPDPLTPEIELVIAQRAAEFNLDPRALTKALVDYAHGCGFECVDWRRQLGVMLREPWAWARPLFRPNASPGESNAEARQRRTRENAAKALGILETRAGPDPFRLAGGE